MSEFNLNALIRDTLARSREPDPHVIARRLVARIPQENRDAALADCLGDRVRIEIGRQRMKTSPVPAHPDDGAQVELGRGGAKTGRSKWTRLGPALRQRYSVGDGWKMLRDCTAEDCDLIAKDYARRSEEQAALQGRFMFLAEVLRSTGPTATVADLEPHVLEMAA